MLNVDPLIDANSIDILPDGTKIVNVTGLAWSTNTSKTVYYTASGAIDCFEHDFNYISQIAMKLNMPGKYNKIKKNARVIKTEDLPAAKLDTLLESVTDRYDMIKIDAQGTKY